MTTKGRSPSLSLRLVALYGMLVAATLLVVAGLVLYLTRSHLTNQLDAGIRRTAASFAEGPGTQVERARDLGPAVRSWLGVLPLPADHFAEVRITRPAKVLSVEGAIRLKHLEGGEQLLRARSSEWHRVGGEDAFRALTVPLLLDGRQIGTLVVGAAEAQVSATLSALLTGIAWAIGAGLLFAGLLAFFAVRRTLRPLAQISSEAQAIQETGDLQRRVAHEGPRDEVGRLAEVFDAMLDRLQESFESQRRFLGDASHELRTPMTVIRGQLELLQREIATDQGRRSIHIGIEELDRMSRIVEDLLLLARLDEGMKFAGEPVEVELVLQEAMLRGLLIAPRTIEVNAEPGLYVAADADRLLQVITNLVSNAVHHAGPEANIALGSRRVGERVLLEVTDNGAGIPAHEIPHVFDRLYRGDMPKTDSPAGAGLGLAIASSLTEAMGGEIRVTSTLGVGTTFTVSLPVVVEPAAPDPAAAGRAGKDVTARD